MKGYIKISILLSIIFLSKGISQTTALEIGPSSYEVQKVPASPDVADLGKFGSIPINKYNGTANINIPIHQIDFEGLSIPISLNYNTSGVRVNQDASWVGLGWNLNEGFTITREINGYDDINSSAIESKSNGWIYTKDYLFPVPPYHLEMTSADLNSLDQKYELQNKPDDTEPDVFNVSLPNGSVRFYLPKIVGSETELIANVISNSKYKVNYNIANKTFKIVDPYGFTYDFTEKEHSTSYGSWEGVQLIDNIPTVTNSTEISALNNMSNWDTNQTKQMIKAWKISKITSPMGKILNFNYQDGFFTSFPSFSDSYSGYAISSTNNNPEYIGSITSVKIFASLTAFNVKYLTGISGDFGSLVFNLENRIDLFSQDAFYRLTNYLGSSSTWNPSISPNTYNAKRLASIDVKDPLGSIIKDVNFNYSYFNQDKVSHTAKEKFIRLKLDSLLIQDQQYSFQYKNENALPEKDSKSIDFWGFYNGQSNSIRTPSYNRFQYFEANSINNFTPYEKYVKLIGANRKSDITYGQYGILNKVVYPTKGSTEFQYEGNSVTLKSPTYTPTFYSNGQFRSSGVSNSEDYNFRYQYLKLANDSSYKFRNNSTIGPCTVSSQPISGVNTNFSVNTYSTFCNSQSYNITVSATLSCSVGCGQGINPSGPAVWIENAQTGQIYNVFNYGGSPYNVNLQQNLNLPIGNYIFKSTAWSVNTPFLVVATVNASAIVYEDATITPSNLDVYEEFEVGGARIYKMINKDFDGTIITTKEYNYDAVNDDQTVSSSGKLMDDLIFASGGAGHFEYTPEAFSGSVLASIHSDNRVRSNPSAAGSHVGYSKVEEYDLDTSNTAKGKITTHFTNIPNEYFNRYIGCTYWALGVCNSGYLTYNFMDQTGGLDCFELQSVCPYIPSNYQTSYGNVYALNTPTISYEHLNGNVQEEFIYDISDNLLSQSIYAYEEYTGGNVGIGYFPVMNFIGKQFPMSSPYIKILATDLKTTKLGRLTSNTTTQFLGLNSLVTVKDYFYEGSNHYLLTKTKTTNSKGESQIAKAYYPQDVSSDPFMSNLISENRVGEPVITEAYMNKNEVPAIADVLLSKQTTVYSNQYSSNNLVLPYKVITQKGDNQTNNQTDRILYEKYDTNGNLLQYKKPDGTSICLIWGYQEQYPIAKIDNATYSQVSSQVANLQTKSNNDNDRTMGSSGNEGLLRTAMESLRNSLPYALVTTYTYDPLIGVTSVSDPKGYTIYYEYDSFNRLKQVKDADGKIVSQNEYQYKNQ